MYFHVATSVDRCWYTYLLHRSLCPALCWSLNPFCRDQTAWTEDCCLLFWRDTDGSWLRFWEAGYKGMIPAKLRCVLSLPVLRTTGSLILNKSSRQLSLMNIIHVRKARKVSGYPPLNSIRRPPTTLTSWPSGL